MPKDIAYWTAQWKNTSGDAAHKTLELLAEYAAFCKSFMGVSTVWGGGFFRLFSLASQNQYREHIEQAIGTFYEASTDYHEEKGLHQVDFILAKVKLTMGENSININDDLYSLLTVIKNNAHINYFAMSIESAKSINDRYIRLYVADDRRYYAPKTPDKS